MLQIGSVVDGKYKILNKIGQGGMSVVYLAMNERANKQWAIKEVRKDGVSEQNFEVIKQGLVAEVDMLKRFNHPHLPSIIDVIDSNDSFLIVMDYIEGVSLNKKLKEAGALPQEDVIEWGKQLCDVLGYLHSRTPPIIYRDMKPANVMLRPDGDVMLIDFGTAREFKSNSVADTTCLGTQGYAAPEQFGGQGLTDSRTDIYCLGATLYHLVTGHNPCEYPYEMYPIRQWNPQLSSGLEQIILKCTQKNPNDRYQSCAELMYALEHYRDFEIETRKKQTVKWRSFIAMAVASAVMFAASGVFKYMDIKTSNFNFMASIDNTESYEDFKNLTTATDIYPKRIEPYKKALDVILQDGKFTSEEHEALIKTILSPSDTHNRTTLKNENEQYYRFRYDLAIAYLFYYEPEHELMGMAKCQQHFEEAAKTPIFETELDGEEYSMTETDKNNARALHDLAGAISDRNGKASNIQVGAVGPTGEEKYTYADYWNQLVAVLNLEFFPESNYITKYKVYNWIFSAMKTDYNNIVDSGVSPEDIVKVRDVAVKDLEKVLKKMRGSEAYYSKVDNLIKSFKNVHDTWKIEK